MSRKIIGITVGTQLPKPNFKQTDPTKGDYIKNKPDFDGLKSDLDGLKTMVGDVPVSEQISNAVSSLEEKAVSPIMLGDFQYYKWGELSGNTIEEQAQQIARFDVVVYQGPLAEDLSMSSYAYQRDLSLYTKALEYNPNLKVFGYVTVRGYTYSNSGGLVGMTEYRTSPENVDHPIWTKEEFAAYINLMAHCGGTKDTSATDEFGNPVLTGGIPLYGVFFDDYDYNFNDDNTHLINQGDWTTIREKHNFLINYVHSCGLHAMPNSNPKLIFDNEATPDSIRNPSGEPSCMNEDDWFCLESYFLRSDYTFATNDNILTIYNEQYRDTYKSKCLALAYTHAVSDDAEDNEQIANTFAIYQALCQGADAIAAHGNLYTEIPDDFVKYYDKDNKAVRTSGNGYYSLSVNGHTITASRSVNGTAYGMPSDSKALATCKVTINGQHIFNNMYIKNEELVHSFNSYKNGVDSKVDELVEAVEQSSNIYHRAFIDDWKQDYVLSDYTNHCFTFENAFGGEDTGASSNWDSQYPYDFSVNLPVQYAWRRVLMDATHLAGKTVELGFEFSDAYLTSDSSTKISNAVWQIIAVRDAGNINITTLNARSVSKSNVDGVERCCVKFTIPEDIVQLMFWTQRSSATPEGAWTIEARGSYLVDLDEYEIQKTWFTNYAPPVSSWQIGTHSTYSTSEEDDSVTVNYGQLNNCWELETKFPANATIFKPGETWEIGFKDIQLTQPSTGKDLTNKVVILFNLDSSLANVGISGQSHSALLSRKSEVSDDRFAIARFTVPDNYIGGMPQKPMYVYTTGYVGGDSDGLYQLYVKGLYMYKLDERDELCIRGEDPSDTYIGINRVRTDTIDEKLEPNALYLVDNGTMFMTNLRGERINISSADTQKSQVQIITWEADD